MLNNNAVAMVRPSERREAEEADFITVDELADMLRLSRNTVYDAIKRGEVPGVSKWGRCVRICRTTVLEWARGEGLETRSRGASR